MCGACSNATIQYGEAALSYDSTGIKADMIIAIEICQWLHVDFDIANLQPIAACACAHACIIAYHTIII